MVELLRLACLSICFIKLIYKLFILLIKQGHLLSMHLLHLFDLPPQAFDLLLALMIHVLNLASQLIVGHGHHLRLLLAVTHGQSGQPVEDMGDLIKAGAVVALRFLVVESEQLVDRGGEVRDFFQGEDLC